MTFLRRLLHRLDIQHGPLSQQSFALWECDFCGKIADHDWDPWSFGPYNWRQPE